MIAPFLAVLLATASLLGASGCGKRSEPGTNNAVAAPSTDFTVALSPGGDLDAIRRRGSLRMLVRRSEEHGLPRHGSPPRLHETYARKFAASLGVEPVWVPVDDVSHLIPALLHREGDLIAANLTVTPSRRQRIAFCHPLGEVREQLVVARDDRSIESKSDLSGKIIGVRQLTSFWDTAQALADAHPDLRIKPLPGRLGVDQILDLVSSGQVDAVIQDSNVMDHVLGYRDDVRVVEDVTGPRAIAWAVHPDHSALRDELNRFVTREKVAFRRLTTYKDDFPGIRKRGVLRVLTRNNGGTYFLWRGELLGYEYDMVRHFAAQHDLTVEMVVAPSWDALIPMLRAGKADLIASFLTITDERRRLGVAFSRPYNIVSEVVVARSNEGRLKSVDDLAGRTLTVRRSSSYWQTLQDLRRNGARFEVRAAPEDEETEHIIAGVADGVYDLTLADRHLVELELAWRDDIRAGLALKQNVSHGWAVRAEDTALLDAVNAFWDREYRGLIANMTYNKYFRSRSSITKHQAGRVDAVRGGPLSPYDELVKPIARKHNFDWRLITAQMYQESRFDPSAKSFAGALGLLQVMPQTGRELGYVNLLDPEIGLRAGVAYLNWTRNRYQADPDLGDRTWFALAAYNAGIGHVSDARRLADQMGWDRRRWFDHVEQAMLLLAKPKYANRAKYGYVRGQEPVKYVREIRDRFRVYVSLTDPDLGRAAQAAPSGAAGREGG